MQVVSKDINVLVVVGLHQGVVSVTTDVEQCPSRLVSGVDMPPGLLFGEGSGLLLFGQGGFSWSRRSW